MYKPGTDAKHILFPIMQNLQGSDSGLLIGLKTIISVCQFPALVCFCCFFFMKEVEGVQKALRLWECQNVCCLWENIACHWSLNYATARQSLTCPFHCQPSFATCHSIPLWFAVCLHIFTERADQARDKLLMIDATEPMYEKKRLHSLLNIISSSISTSIQRLSSCFRLTLLI